MLRHGFGFSHVNCKNAPDVLIQSPSQIILRLHRESAVFGLKSSSSLIACAMAAYRVTLTGPKGEQRVLNAPDNEFILDAAEEAGLELPHSCRAGACSACAGKLVSGTVDQSEQNFLDDEQMAKGYLLTCFAFPAADSVIPTLLGEELVG